MIFSDSSFSDISLDTISPCLLDFFLTNSLWLKKINLNQQFSAILKNWFFFNFRAVKIVGALAAV